MPWQQGARVKLGFAAGACVLAAAIAGCGSSSKSSSSSSSKPSNSTTVSSSHAAGTKPQRIPGATPKAGAVSARTAGLTKLLVVPKGAGFAPHISGLDGIPITQAIPTIAGDINQFWTTELANSGVQFPQAQEVLVQSSPVQNPCTNTPIAPTDPASYCGQGSAGQSPATVTFYWTVPWMQKNMDTDPGRVNLTFDMAWFWSLYIQDVAGYTQALTSGKMTKAQYAEQNTCLTGIYVRSLAQRQLIEKGDTETANQWVNTLAGTANGITAPDVTSKQLQQAFVTGFQSGDPKSCGFGTTS